MGNDNIGEACRGPEQEDDHLLKTSHATLLGLTQQIIAEKVHAFREMSTHLS